MARLAKLINMPLLQELANIVSGGLHSLSLNMPLLADANCSRLWIVGSVMRFLNDVSTSFVEIDRVCAFLECLSTFASSGFVLLSSGFHLPGAGWLRVHTHVSSHQQGGSHPDSLLQL